MSRYITLGIIAALIIAGIGGYIYALRVSNSSLAASLADLGEKNGRLELANQTQAKTLARLESASAANDALVVRVLEQNNALESSSRALEQKLKEALNASPTLALDSLLPADAALALCLQHHQSSAGIGEGDSADPSGGSVAGARNPAAPDCSRWQRVSVREAVEYNRLLLLALGKARKNAIALNIWSQEARHANRS